MSNDIVHNLDGSLIAQKYTLAINDRDNKLLLAIHPDGTVEGEIEDASEAARVFFRELKSLFGNLSPIDVKPWVKELEDAIENDTELKEAFSWTATTAVKFVEAYRKAENA